MMCGICSSREHNSDYHTEDLRCVSVSDGNRCDLVLGHAGHHRHFLQDTFSENHGRIIAWDKPAPTLCGICDSVEHTEAWHDENERCTAHYDQQHQCQLRVDHEGNHVHQNRRSVCAVRYEWTDAASVPVHVTCGNELSIVRDALCQLSKGHAGAHVWADEKRWFKWEE